MKQQWLLLILLWPFSFAISQEKRSLKDLINTQDPGWPVVKKWIAAASNKVEILAVDTAKAKSALYETQVTTRSPMGAIVYETGGILIDDGWIRILGSGSNRLNRSLPEWNIEKTLIDSTETSGFYLIADDAIGGFFIMNGGFFGKDIGKIYYFSPDNLEFEPMDWSYSDFLSFCFNNDLNKFYEGYRWKGWRNEVAALPGDKVYNFVPPLWTKEGKDFSKNSRKAISVKEQFELNVYFRKQLGIQ